MPNCSGACSHDEDPKVVVACEIFENPLSFSCWTISVNALEVLRSKAPSLQIDLDQIQSSCPTCEDDTMRRQPDAQVGHARFLASLFPRHCRSHRSSVFPSSTSFRPSESMCPLESLVFLYGAASQAPRARSTASTSKAPHPGRLACFVQHTLSKAHACILRSDETSRQRRIEAGSDDRLNMLPRRLCPMRLLLPLVHPASVVYGDARKTAAARFRGYIRYATGAGPETFPTYCSNRTLLPGFGQPGT